MYAKTMAITVNVRGIETLPVVLGAIIEPGSGYVLLPGCSDSESAPS